jgi:hypothetical protein
VSGQDGNGTTVCTLVQPNTASCDLGTMAPGDSKTVFITALVAPSVPRGTVLANTVTVSSTTPDPDLSNNSATFNSAVDTRADIWLDKTAVLMTGNPAPVLTYTLYVHNNGGCETDAQALVTPNCGVGGPSDAQNVTVTDNLPLDAKKLVVQFVSPGCTYNKTLHSVTCNSATIPAGATATFVIQSQVQGSVGTFLNTATATTATVDPNLSNNTNSASVTVKGGTGRTK